MSSYERWRWRTINVLRRMFGVAATTIGVVFAAQATALLLRPQSTLDLGGVPTSALEPKLVILGGSIAVLIFGVLMVRAVAYRPDLGDTSWLVEPQVAGSDGRRDRTWWTGDRKASRGHAAI